MKTKTYLLTIRETCGGIHTILVAADSAFDAVQSVAPCRVTKVIHR